KEHLDAFAGVPNVEIAALCDVDETILRKRGAEVGGNPETVVDVRRLLDDRSIDAISIATPNHWHALMAIWACQAGKDVYVEKPCSHNVWEGRQLVRAAEKYHRIVQHGTQSRSARAMVEAIDHLHGGTFGEIYLARGLCFKWRDTIGRAPTEPVPTGVDYDLWTGPAPLKPFTRIAFITTGTGSGTRETATSATRASTKSMPPGGGSASGSPTACPRLAAISCSTTTR